MITQHCLWGGECRNYEKTRFMLHKVNIPISNVEDCRIKLKIKRNILNLKWVWETKLFCVKNRDPAKFTVLIKKRVYARNAPERLSIWNLSIAFFYQDGSLMKVFIVWRSSDFRKVVQITPPPSVSQCNVKQFN